MKRAWLAAIPGRGVGARSGVAKKGLRCPLRGLLIFIAGKPAVSNFVGFPCLDSGSILTSSRHAIATRARRAENSAEFTASRRIIDHLFIYDFEMNE